MSFELEDVYDVVMRTVIIAIGVVIPIVSMLIVAVYTGDSRVHQRIEVPLLISTLDLPVIQYISRALCG